MVPVSVVTGVIALGCSSATPAASSRSTPGSLKVNVTSVTPTLEPYNPQLSNHGIPAEQVNFTVIGLPTPPTDTYLHCHVAVSHSGQQVGTTSMVAGVSATPPPPPLLGPYETRGGKSRQSVSVEVTGDNFEGQPSDAHVACLANASPIGK